MGYDVDRYSVRLDMIVSRLRGDFPQLEQALLQHAAHEVHFGNITDDEWFRSASWRLLRGNTA
jgi:hypothetical protein